MICKECGNLLISTYKNEKELTTIRSRKCKNCGYKIQTVEIPKDEYEYSVETLNNIIDLLRK